MQSTRNKLIDLLAKNHEIYISGEALSKELNISRTAIWKHMKELEKDGYEIEGKPKKGYRILKYPDKLSENTIKWGLNTKWLGKVIHHKTKTTSTQHIAHQLAQEGATDGTVIIADEQTMGKGRMDRKWYSTKNKGIWLSIILKPSIMPHQAPQLTLLTATVLADVIARETNLVPYIKWPNDIVSNNKKLSGILTEMQADQDRIQYVVIGIGMNVNQEEDDLPNDIQEKATSLKIETKQEQDLRKMIQKILEQFEITYEYYLENGFAPIKEKWESYGFRIGEQIMINTFHDRWKATFSGIADDGSLMVKKLNGEEVKLYSAEIDWYQRGD